MTVERIIGKRKYIGLSTDAKPSAEEPGAEFYETDTAVSYLWTGTTWAEVEDGGEIHVELGDIEADIEGAATDIADIEVLLTTLNGLVDGLEALIGTTNSALVTIDGRVDGLEALIGTTNSTLTTIDGRIDGVEALLATMDADTSAMAVDIAAIVANVDNRLLGEVTEAVDSKAANYTSDAVDCRGYNSLFTITYDEGSFAGTITLQGALGDGASPDTAYADYGAALTVQAGDYKLEMFENCPPFVKVDVVRSAGTVSVWVQPFSRR